jgi:hypothetical protein
MQEESDLTYIAPIAEDLAPVHYPRRRIRKQILVRMLHSEGKGVQLESTLGHRFVSAGWDAC